MLGATETRVILLLTGNLGRVLPGAGLEHDAEHEHFSDELERAMKTEQHLVERA
jgi:hypothetical protein